MKPSEQIREILRTLDGLVVTVADLRRPLAVPRDVEGYLGSAAKGFEATLRALRAALAEAEVQEAARRVVPRPGGAA